CSSSTYLPRLLPPISPPLPPTLFPYTTLFRSDLRAHSLRPLFALMAGRAPHARADIGAVACHAPRQLLRIRQGVVTHVISVVLRSEEHTSELQSRENLVCRLLLEKKKQDRAIT